MISDPRGIKSTFLLLLFLFLMAPGVHAEDEGSSPHNIYVMLGFHMSFYHSWRGDTNDEAGFGQDIRVVRAILDTLDQANAEGLEARGYWDIDAYYTLENILPFYAPDILERIRQRVDAGLDEVVVAPYNNGANHAATEKELRAALSQAMHNFRGSGLRQLFGEVTPLYRPQECMYTAGQNRILLDEGLEGIILYYSGLPFDSFSTYIPPLPTELRYNPLRIRAAEDEPPVTLLPAVSPGDVVNHVSMEKWLLDLRKSQTSGEVRTDLLLHINFDADADTWLPVNLPKGMKWFPNAGGLMEYIRAVARYPWAHFTTPAEYLQTRPPRGDVLIRQDLADGGFDGQYSWAEKFSSLSNWSALERSRLHTYRAMALADRLPPFQKDRAQQQLWDGTESAFFLRFTGLTTTHFGMSTPVLNEERQARAEVVLSAAEEAALEVERDSARELRTIGSVSADSLYVFEVYDFARDALVFPGPVPAIVRVPLVLPPGAGDIEVRDQDGRRYPFSWVNVSVFPDGSIAGELLAVVQLIPGAHRSFRVVPSTNRHAVPQQTTTLKNPWTTIALAESTGVKAFLCDQREIGGPSFLDPFVTYRSHTRPRHFGAERYTFGGLENERWQGIQRAQLQTDIAMPTQVGEQTSRITYTFTLFDTLPYVVVDVDAHYARTPPRDVIQTMQQKLRQLLDLRWIEVAPFQIHPSISAPAERPLRVWKHNYLDVTSYYDLNYGEINRKNRNLDSFNHQVTAGWVAVSNGQSGLLLAENSEVLSSMAFCPMRLRERGGEQTISLNPFGSYYGHQLDYSHLGGNKVGTDFAIEESGSLKPNGPSYNGVVESFSLLLAPYSGDAPPAELQLQAMAFFYPPGVLFTQVPAFLERAVVPEDVRDWIARKKAEIDGVDKKALPAPAAILANPGNEVLQLVWEAPSDTRIEGYQLRWKEKGEGDAWQEISLEPTHRHTLSSLKNGARYLVQVRVLGAEGESEWSEVAEGVPGPVEPVGLGATAKEAPLGLLMRTFYYGLVHHFATR